MRIFITGGNGFIGNALHKYLHNTYHYKIFAPSSKELDLSNEMAVDSYIAKNKPDWIIHLANKGGGRNSLDLHDIAEYNLRMFFAIMKQANRVDKILHFGSGAEYSKHKPIVCASESNYLEFMPLDSYGFYKNITSRFIESTSDNIVCLRIFGCYGIGENYRYKFISNAIVKTLLQLPITIYKDCLFDYIYINDLIHIIDYFLHNQMHHKIYNASSGKPILLSELAQIINQISNQINSTIILHNELNNEYTSDNSRLLQEINLTLTPHAQAIAEMFDYFKRNIHALDIDYIKQDSYLHSIPNMWQSQTHKSVKLGGGGQNYS